MGCDISENYYFAGSIDGVKNFYNFLKSADACESCSSEEKRRSLEQKLITLLREKYLIDEIKLCDFGFGLEVGEIKIANGLSAFPCWLWNRNAISAHVFKELLDNYFPGVYMYFAYSGDSYLFNTFSTNDRDQRFFTHGEPGMCYLHGDYNSLQVLYDGNYTRKEIIDSYKLFLGNSDINSDYLPVFCSDKPLSEDQYHIEEVFVENAQLPELSVEECHALCKCPPEIITSHGLKPEWLKKKQMKIDYKKYPELECTPHIVGQYCDGSLYLYRAVVQENPLRIPDCIRNFDEAAFDWCVIAESIYKNKIEKPLTLILTSAQTEALEAEVNAAKEKEGKFAGFFDTVKTDKGKILLEYKTKQKADNKKSDSEVSADGFPDDIPF